MRIGGDVGGSWVALVGLNGRFGGRLEVSFESAISPRQCRRLRGQKWMDGTQGLTAIHVGIPIKLIQVVFEKLE